MEINEDRILEELFLIDPALRAEEDALKRAIRKLMDEKPGAAIDPAFEKNLRDELLAKFSAKAKKKRSPLATVFFHPAFRGGIGLAAAACLVVVITTNPVPAPNAQFSSREEAVVSKDANSKKPLNPPDKPKPAIGSQNNSPVSGEWQGQGFSPSVPSKEAAGQIMLLKESKRSKSSLDSLYMADTEAIDTIPLARYNDGFNTEGYDMIRENQFAESLKEPLSTFSIDVDTASYANVRRFITQGGLPNPDAVRIEELVNYFDYGYPAPSGDEPIALDTELSKCPWNADHLVLRIGMQARNVAEADIPPTNLVFLIDVSGSMGEENKLPLVKESLKLLVAKMRKMDRIAIVVYAGSAGLVLPSTPGDRKKEITSAIDTLESGGSTAGGEGILLAYESARKAYIKGGNNRVVLATDGDFNVGASSDSELVRMIELKRNEGVFLTVLGFGQGNYKDSKMQGLADSGNGNYAYIDTLAEAKKALVRQMAGTLFTIAKDVKIQIEFNPAVVGEYRLIGYENRMLSEKDFSDDAKDAGELGAGSSVTALYELIPSSGTSPRNDLKYQRQSVPSEAAGGRELATVKFRYKKPDSDVSRLIEKTVGLTAGEIRGSSESHRFALAVAEWGLLLRNSVYRASASYSRVISTAAGALGPDKEGYRAEFIGLAVKSKALAAESGQQ